MPSQPRIHLVRHAQGFHNLGSEFHSLPDPRLTPHGESQCATLQAEHFPPEKQQNISLVTASPLCRTIHTAHLVFSPALHNGKCVPCILAIPDAQETSDFPCDTGSDPEVLRSICKENGWNVDLSLVTEGWNIKTLDSRYSPASDAIKARARDCRVLLRQKARELSQRGDTDVELVLVTHGGFLHYLTNDWEDADNLSGTGWQNCEARTYVFENDFADDADGDAYFVETMESRTKRGKNYPMFDHQKQEELFHKTMQGWEDQGLQNPAKLGVPLEPEDAEVNDAEVEGQKPAAKNMSLDRNSGDVKVMA
ncbi:hypothetical protein ABEF92_001703 [Exophiala dermatitidis]|uniref:Phosphoglycerate mutase n=1 Tax=Exophiala dermatitidis (strain ATCC 34100 / CBS 525.76 / NIH/UT8656) TaxID=858893 RepID=H6C2L4_EXODN|nr:uncharacterized protein HMPREF1120_05952 [Exophiala dermatitidis NIH/UT8656]EHY57932.1 hypothetical protein HMPREF1120_05952 [Exophiala dermatitidis NIH/UT8656]